MEEFVEKFNFIIIKLQQTSSHAFNFFFGFFKEIECF